jgi:hypothetical protein
MVAVMMRAMVKATVLSASTARIWNRKTLIDGADCKHTPSRVQCETDCKHTPSRVQCETDCKHTPSRVQCETDCKRALSRAQCDRLQACPLKGAL